MAAMNGTQTCIHSNIIDTKTETTYVDHITDFMLWIIVLWRLLSRHCGDEQVWRWTSSVWKLLICLGIHLSKARHKYIVAERQLARKVWASFTCFSLKWPVPRKQTFTILLVLSFLDTVLPALWLNTAFIAHDSLFVRCRCVCHGEG